ncbi:MAG: response regulator, partial [Verrucomicrobiae bacterium]|nr:response regulator [Verrucomicrobiae bacterium]
LELLDEHANPHIDLLLTDVVMPRMSGRELAELLRRGQPNLKVLFISGYSTEAEEISRSLSLSTFYLPKPFSASTLGHKVRSVLDA